MGRRSGGSHVVAAAGVAGAPPDREAAPGVTLDAEAVRRMGIATVPVGMTDRAGTVALTGTLVADPGSVTTIRAPIAGRLLAVAGGRWPLLGEQVAAGRTLAQVADARPLQAPRGGIATAIDARPGDMVQPGQVLLVLTDFAHPLAQIVWRPDAPPFPPARVTLRALADSTLAAAGVLVGPAPVADTLTGNPMFVYRVTATWRDARPGLPVLATVADPRQRHRGIFVPAAATLQWNGFAWLYVQRGVDRFDRVQLDTSTPVAGGWLVASGVRPGDHVVTRGAGQLLSEELRAASAGGASRGGAAGDGDAGD